VGAGGRNDPSVYAHMNNKKNNNSIHNSLKRKNMDTQFLTPTKQ
jgi:hypothetical protein